MTKDEARYYLQSSGFSEEQMNTIEQAFKQEPKTGHWESTELFYGGESKGAIIKCSECGNEFKVSPKVFERLYDNERFCNHCGCRMVEPQERSDKE